jgi:hypothetical protein
MSPIGNGREHRAEAPRHRRPLVLIALLLFAAPGHGAWFREVAEAWGLAFRHHNGSSGRRYMPETLNGGVVLLDYDLDGDWDVFFIDGGVLPGYAGSAPRSRLLRNDRGGRFVEVTPRVGLESAGYPSGGTAGDVDGDGDVDLYVTALGANTLWSNQGDGTFRDVTAAAGVGDEQWSASAALGDVDGDGDLDLYVADYVGFTLAAHRDCLLGDIPGYCMPDAYGGAYDRFYANRGNGTFIDATVSAGLLPPRALPGLGVAIADLTDDALPDIVVANDSQANYFYRNRGDGTFVEEGLVAGVAYGEDGSPEASMGIAVGDVDGDRDQDLVMTHFEFESNALYVNSGGGLFRDQRFPAGVAEGSFASLAFGVVLADLDHDADLDLVTANGHIQDTATLLNEHSTFPQRNQLWENLGAGRFRESGMSGFAAVRVSRGLAAGDLDGDGDLDLVFVNNDGVAEVYENLAAGNWLQVDFGSAVREAGPVAARVDLVETTGSQRRDRVEGGSYLSRSAPTLHFGMGGGGPARLDVRVPGRERRLYDGLPPRRRVRLP